MNSTAQHTPQAAFPRILPRRVGRCAKRHELRSSLACPRPAMSPRTVHPAAPQNSDSGRLQSLPCRTPKDNHPPGRISTNRRRRLAVTRACGTVPPPLGVAACRACHAPDAAMFPLGTVARPACQVTSTRAPSNQRRVAMLEDSHLRIRDHREASCQLRLPHPSSREPIPPRPLPPKAPRQKTAPAEAHSGTASHSGGSAKQPVRTAAPPAACFTLPALYECSVPTTPAASARRTAPAHAPTISRARRSRRMNHTPAIVRHRQCFRDQPHPAARRASSTRAERPAPPVSALRARAIYFHPPS